MKTFFRYYGHNDSGHYVGIEVHDFLPPESEYKAVIKQFIVQYYTLVKIGPHMIPDDLEYSEDHIPEVKKIVEDMLYPLVPYNMEVIKDEN